MHDGLVTMQFKAQLSIFLGKFLSFFDIARVPIIENEIVYIVKNGRHRNIPSDPHDPSCQNKGISLKNTLELHFDCQFFVFR